MSNFILLSGLRTGSNWLREILNNHPDIQCHNVVFSDNRSIDHTFNLFEHNNRFKYFFTRPSNTKKFREYFIYLNKISAGFQCWGTKIHFHHLSSNQEFVPLITDQNFHVVFLRRENVLKQAISLEIARATKRWTLRQDQKKDYLPNYHFDHSLIKQMEQLKKNENEARKLFHDYPLWTDITYEDLLLEKDQILEDLFNRLKVKPYHDLNSKVIKQNSENLEELVSNFDEMRLQLQGSKFEKYLN